MERKEAIEIVRKLYNESLFMKKNKEAMVTLIPELKESEDERIRKELIEFVKSRGGFKQEYIAWIEKQGKNNMGISEATKKKLEDNLNKALEKETPESFNEFLDEQKPAGWSEEDEYCLDGAIETEMYMLDVVNGIKKFDVGNESIKEECTKELNWLKSLKERYTWKPSGEQMQALKDAFNDAIMQYDFKGSPIKEEVTRKHAETIESLYNDLKKL